jgi:hypothetical protein
MANSGGYYARAKGNSFPYSSRPSDNPLRIISLFTQSPWFEYSSWWSYWFSLLSLVPKAIDFIVRVIATYDAYNVAKLTGTEDEAKSL